MVDDGTGADAAAGDGIYTATISTAGMTAGQMLRWRVTALDTMGDSSKLPLFPDPLDSPEYFGTIAEDPSVDSSNLPIFHWFTSSPS